MMQELGLIHEAAAHLRGPGRARQPALPSRTSTASDTFEPIAAAADAGHGDPDRQPGQRRARRSGRCSSSTASSSRPPRPSWPTPRRGPTGPGMFNCPHTGVALAALEKLVARGTISRQRPRGRGLHRQRPEVHRLQGRSTTRASWPASPNPKYANPRCCCPTTTRRPRQGPPPSRLGMQGAAIARAADGRRVPGAAFGLTLLLQRAAPCSLMRGIR